MTNHWIENGWKVVFPEQKIFFMKEHNWAFLAWDIALKNGWTRKNSTLIHVDGHLDAGSDSLRVPNLLESNTIEELSTLTKEEEGDFDFVGIDNFIFAGLARKSVGRVCYVCPYKRDEQINPLDLGHPLRHFDGIKELLSEDTISRYITGSRFFSIDDFQFFVERDGFFEEAQTYILDLDLDIFIEEYLNEKGVIIGFKLEDEIEVRRKLSYLKEVYPWDCITVAISPKYCYSEDNASELLRIFTDIFHIQIEQGIPWETLNVIP